MCSQFKLAVLLFWQPVVVLLYYKVFLFCCFLFSTLANKKHCVVVHWLSWPKCCGVISAKGMQGVDFTVKMLVASLCKRLTAV